jgi:hypothetical protein
VLTALLLFLQLLAVLLLAHGWVAALLPGLRRLLLLLLEDFLLLGVLLQVLVVAVHGLHRVLCACICRGLLVLVVLCVCALQLAHGNGSLGHQPLQSSRQMVGHRRSWGECGCQGAWGPQLRLIRMPEGV